jgi:hypothetical protein
VTHEGLPWQNLREFLPPEVRTIFQQARTLIPDLPLIHFVADQPLAALCRDASYVDTLNDRLDFVSLDNPDPMVLPGWKYLSSATYRDNSYKRPATLLNVLERIVGRDQWWEFMRVFHARSRFAHPTTNDFVSLLGEMCGEDVAGFFRNSIAGNVVMDYGIHSVSPRSDDRPAEVIVRRYGTLSANVSVRFLFEGNEEAVVRAIPAEETSPWTKFTFDKDAAGTPYGALLEVWVDPPLDPSTVEIDAGPAGIYLNDINLLNNAWRRDPDHRPAIYRGVRHLLQVQSRLSHALLIG